MKTLAIIYLVANAFFVLAISFESVPEVSSALYMVTGFIWLIIGNWMAIKILNTK